MSRSTEIKIAQNSWPIMGEFAISREVKKTADTILVEITKNGITGCGESVPLKRYGHTQKTVVQTIEKNQQAIIDCDMDVIALQSILSAGPARNAVDCAFWDWRRRYENKSWAEIMEQSAINPLKTSYTLSLDHPDKMAKNAQEHKDFTILKMKMKGDDLDIQRLERVKKLRPDAQLILDANEAWTVDHMDNLMPILIENDVVLIEQPLPECEDSDLKNYQSPIPIVADESCHVLDNLDCLVGKYQYINIKLDKTGGLTHALEMLKQAQKLNFKVMVGCMASTSLAIVPAILVGQEAQYCDLDGAFLLERDPYHLVSYNNGRVSLI